MKDQLIIVASTCMDENKKPSRNENRLIRMSEKTRARLGLENDKVVDVGKENMEGSVSLQIFHAYRSDLRDLRKADELTLDEMARVGFVSTATYYEIFGHGVKKTPNRSIWISDDIEGILVGTDPEFILIDPDEGVPIYAQDVVLGYDKFAILGHDGPLMELRPTPSQDAHAVVAHMTQILKNDPVTEKIKKYNWVAGCNIINPHGDDDVDSHSRKYWPIGGHIHLGTPAAIYNEITSGRAVNTKGVKLFGVIAKILSELIAIPLMRFDGKQETVIRRTYNHSMGTYGNLGQERTKKNRLEYRVLSGMWMAHPDMAEAVLGTTKAVAEAIYQHIYEDSFQDKLSKMQAPASMDWEDFELGRDFGATRSYNDVVHLLKSYGQVYDSAYFKILEKTLESLSTYNKYRKCINKFVTIVSTSDQNVDSLCNDIKKNWLKKTKLKV